jgi:hypothetical protein
MVLRKKNGSSGSKTRRRIGKNGSDRVTKVEFTVGWRRRITRFHLYRLTCLDEYLGEEEKKKENMKENNDEILK